MNVLHIVENLDRGAVENWLLRMHKHARAGGADIAWTFYCTLGAPGARDEETRAEGARIIHSPVAIGQKSGFLRALRAELRRGNYDVLHCHHDLVSAVYLLAAARIPMRRRIVHVHNADEEVLTPSRFKQLLYREPMRRLCLSMADRIVGNSNHTLDTFLAGRTRRPTRDLVHYYGVDPAPFQKAKGNRLEFRRRLGVAEDARLLLFAGRTVPEKNPLFALETLAQLHRMNPAAVGIFVGSGSLDEAMVRRAAELDLDSAFRALGWRDDVAEIMSCCDWFILPHPETPMEGFGLAVVEAQLAGLRLLLSKGVPDDPLLPMAAFRRLPLAAGPRAWADAAMELLSEPAPQASEALTALRQSPMDMDRALHNLLELHA